MALRIHKVSDANVYVNNDSKHGLASEVTCPNVSYNMNDYNALGMVGTARFPDGIEAMEATIKWKYPDNDAQIELANPFRAVDIMVRSNKGIYLNEGRVENRPIVIFLSGFPMQHQGGTYASKTDVELESQIAVNYYKLEVDMEEIIEVDVLNNILKIGGIDVMAEYRKNLGI